MATPAQNASVFGNDNIVVQASDGSVVNVTGRGERPYLRLTQYEQRTRLVASSNSEAALLSAYRADVAPLLGRDGAIADLRRWLEAKAPASMRALVGAGGRGKTRLALEFARRISAEGWLAGFVEAHELDRFRAQHNVAEWRWDKPVLVIVDYAASRSEQIRAWARELANAALDDARPRLRLLLIERQASRAIGWLAAILGGGDDASRAVSALFDPPEPVELPAIDDLEFRRQIFAALPSRGGGLAAPARGADVEFDRLLADRKWAGDPLYLMMAGLAAGRVGVREALTLSRADLALEVAERELNRIGDIGAAHGVDAAFQNHRGAFVRHLAVMATLTQGLTREEARGLAEGELSALRSSAPLNASLEAVCDALPGAGGNGGVAPILPDIVGEGAILAWLGKDGPVAQWGLPSAARIAAAARNRLPRVSAVVVRAAQDFAVAGRDEPVRWLESLAATADADVGALMQIANALPSQTLALRELAARLTGRITDALRTAVVASEAQENADGRESLLALRGLLATSLNNLGNRLSNLGRREEALAAAREAVEIRRRLAADRPDAFLPDLATSLNNLGNRLGDLGRREEALAAAREAVEIRRRLAADRPDAFLPDLATSLNNLGNRLSDLGRREEALAAAREAVEIRRRLAADRPDAFLPNLAASLNNLGVTLSELGRREEALAAAREASEIYRRLAADRPDAFLPDLAMSLSNLGNRLSELGRRDDALAAAREAVEIRRRLAADRPDAFLPDLATSLNNLGAMLSDLGRREEALAAARDAVAVLAPFFLRLPAAHAQRMATMVGNYLKRCEELGVEPEAELLGPIFATFQILEKSQTANAPPGD
jgi:tetratricopeptide (TPR) repeat protein